MAPSAMLPSRCRDPTIEDPAVEDRLQDFRATPLERQRTQSLMAMLPAKLGRVLDIGTRDGHFARMLADRGASVVALDLERPQIDHPGVETVKGDATALAFPDGAFDLVLCAEVLEHIPGSALDRACAEITRVCSGHALIGVPYRQDLRLWRTSCRNCGKSCPPWGHVNSFDERRLQALFPGLSIAQKAFVGTAELGTNNASAWLMDLAGNPYGTYVQDEPCVHCGARLAAPTGLGLSDRALVKAAMLVRAAHNLGRQPHANWIHLLMRKNGSPGR
jgi:SAM-dependent methyltransferase